MSSAIVSRSTRAPRIACSPYHGSDDRIADSDPREHRRAAPRCRRWRRGVHAPPPGPEQLRRGSVRLPRRRSRRGGRHRRRRVRGRRGSRGARGGRSSSSVARRPERGDDDLDERIAAARARRCSPAANFADALARARPRDHARAPRLHRALHHAAPRGSPLRHALLRVRGVGSPQEVRVHAAEAVEGGWYRPESMLAARVPCDHAAHADDVPRVRPARIRRCDPRNARRVSPIEVTDITPEIIAGWMALEHERARAVTETTRVLAPNPSVFTGRGTNTYLVGGERTLICIDPGPDDDAHLAAILDAAAAASAARITTIVLTHSHPDHRPLARASRRAHRAQRVHCFDPSAGDENAQVHARRRRRARGRGRAGRGAHARDTRATICASTMRRRATLYTGDHILSGTTTVIHPGEGDMSDYMESLRRVRDLSADDHLPRSRRARRRRSVADRRVHRASRSSARRRCSTRRAARRHRSCRWTSCPTLYAGYPVDVYPLAAWTVQAHLDKLVLDGRRRSSRRRRGQRGARATSLAAPERFSAGGSCPARCGRGARR